MINLLKISDCMENKKYYFLGKHMSSLFYSIFYNNMNKLNWIVLNYSTPLIRKTSFIPVKMFILSIRFEYVKVWWSEMNLKGKIFYNIIHMKFKFIALIGESIASTEYTWRNADNRDRTNSNTFIGEGWDVLEGIGGILVMAML